MSLTEQAQPEQPAQAAQAAQAEQAEQTAQAAQAEASSVKKSQSGQQFEVKLSATSARIQRQQEGETEIVDSLDFLESPNLPKSHVRSKLYILHSLIVSVAMISQALYWQLFAHNMDETSYMYSCSHLLVSTGFACVNAVPAVLFWVDVYSPALSMVVLLNAMWVIYHTIASWLYNICAYDQSTPACDSAISFTFITLGLLLCSIFQQIVFVVNATRKTQDQYKEEEALKKAEVLNITDDLEMHRKSLGTDQIEPEKEAGDGATAHHHCHSQAAESPACSICAWVKTAKHNSEAQLNTMGLSVDVPKSATDHALRVQ